MIYYDIHTHQPPKHPEDVALITIDIRQPCTLQEGLYAAGIHPWHADREALPLLRTLATHPNVVAIGETGLDKRTPTPRALQEEVFTAQVQLAGEVRKPLIIHCVHAWPELMAIRKTNGGGVPWIIHGFRGNSLLAAQLLQTGFFLSFGIRFQPEAARRAWEVRRLLAETDDADLDIREVYDSLASRLAIREEALAQEIVENWGDIFST